MITKEQYSSAVFTFTDLSEVLNDDQMDLLLELHQAKESKKLQQRSIDSQSEDRISSKTVFSSL